MAFDDFMVYVTRCDHPKFDPFLSAQEFVRKNALGCPLCSRQIKLVSRCDCGGYGEFYDTLYIRCDPCRLEKMVFVPLGENMFDSLRNSILRWNVRTNL